MTGEDLLDPEPPNPNPDPQSQARPGRRVTTRLLSRLLVALLIAAPAAVVHAQAEPAQEAPASDPEQPAADQRSGADQESEPWTRSVREAAQPVLQDVVEHYAIYL